jgi:hypothetical protein
MTQVPETEAERNERITLAMVKDAQAALDAHENAGRFEGDAYIQMWQLVVSLREYCAHKGLDFEEILADTQRQMACGDVTAPAYKKMVDAAAQKPEGWYASHTRN